MLAGHSNIDIAPNVPDMVREIGRSWVSIAPMRSGVGIKNKVLEAWACARPVVLSRLATNGLIVPADHAGLVGTNAEAMAASVLALFNDADRRRRLGHRRAKTFRRISPGPAPRRASMRCCANESRPQRVAHRIGVGIRVGQRLEPETHLERPQDRVEIIRRMIDIAALHRRSDEDERNPRAGPHRSRRGGAT